MEKVNKLKRSFDSWKKALSKRQVCQMIYFAVPKWILVLGKRKKKWGRAKYRERLTAAPDENSAFEAKQKEFVKKKSGSHPLHCNLYIRGALVSQPLSSYT
jgi:hypothetical protein